MTVVKIITPEHHLHRSDDAVALGGRVAWITSNTEARELCLRIVDVSLNYQMISEK